MWHIVAVLRSTYLQNILSKMLMTWLIPSLLFPLLVLNIFGTSWWVYLAGWNKKALILDTTDFRLKDAESWAPIVSVEAFRFRAPSNDPGIYPPRGANPDIGGCQKGYIKGLWACLCLCIVSFSLRYTLKNVRKYTPKCKVSKCRFQNDWRDKNCCFRVQ